MNNNKKIAIAFDLGTTSVGWSIVKINSENNNENLEILDMGVRLFDDPSSSDTNIKNRREARSRRRRINRSKIRRKDLVKLLIKYKIISEENEFKDIFRSSYYDPYEERFLLPVEIKIKGIKNKNLSKQEIVIILSNWLKHRGALNTIDDLEEDEKEKEILINDYNKNLFPCENQMNWFNITGKVIGNDQNSIISNQQYIEEIREILNKQELINDSNFIEEYIDLFKRHRHYSKGPGSEKSPTKYGLWQINEENKVVKKGENLWDTLVGKCTYYKDEIRNHKKSPITEYFNLMNDFANLKIRDINGTGDRYLTFKEKKEALKKSEKLTLNDLLKKINFSNFDIVSGIKKDNKGKPVIEELKSLKSISKWLIESKIKDSIDFSSLEEIIFIDNIFNAGISKQNIEERKNIFKANQDSLFNKVLTEEQIEQLCKLKIWKTGSSSLSKKAQIEFINFAFSEGSEGKNQMVYFQKYANISTNDEKILNFKYLQNNLFINEMMSLTVKRTFNQAIKVLNSILKNKKYSNYEISHIFVELAREMNSEDEKKRIEFELKSNQKYLEKKLEEHDLTKDDIKGKDKRLKFLLWIEQNKMDIYDGEHIDINDLLKNDNNYHIDHILPISVSLNDSFANKVLTKAKNNEEKKDQTPYQWLSSKGKYEEYKKRCQSLLQEVQDKKLKNKLDNKIKNYLLNEKDIDEDFVGFISRQLNDTRYISTLFYNQLKSFFTNSKYWNKMKIVIQPINGSLTTYARDNWFAESDCDKKLLIKNRHIYTHHAIDASIIAFLGLNYKIQNLLKFKLRNNEIVPYINENNEKVWVDKSTGEMLHKKSDFFKEQSKTSKYFRDQMREFLDSDVKNKFIRFSRMVNKKSNLALSNETLYSMREFEGKKHKVSKINILDSNNIEKLNKFFGPKALDKEKDKLAIYRKDKKLYENLSKIFEENYTNEKTNPFSLYLQNEYVKSKNPHAEKLDKIPIFIDDNKINWVRNIKIFENEIKDPEEILTINKIHKNSKNVAFYDSLKTKSVRIYKDKKGKYRTIFINALNLKWDREKEILVVDENKVNKQLEKNNIEVNSRFLEIESGKTLILNNELFYFVGGGHRKSNKLEIKIISMKNELAYKFSNWKKAPKRDQWQIATSTIAEDFKLCKVDPLGNVYDIFSFDDYFENNLLKY